MSFRLAKESSLYILGEIFSKSIPFLLLPYLTRKLGVSGFGELSYYQTIQILILILIGLSQDGAVMRYYYVYGKRALGLIVSTGYMFTISLSILFYIFCLFVDSYILLFVALAATFQSLVSVQLSLNQCQRQVKRFFIIQSGYSLLLLFNTVLFFEVFGSQKIEYYFVAMFLANILVLISIFYYNPFKGYVFKRYYPRQYWVAFKYILVIGTPLLLHQLSLFTKGKFDRVLIYENFTSQELGIYSAGLQIASVLAVILMAINRATVPYYYQAIKEGKITIAQIKKWVFISLLMIPIAPLFAYFIPNSLYIFVLGHGFEQAQYYSIVFLIGFGLTVPYFILVNYLFYYAKNNIISACSLASTLIYLGFLFFILQYGIECIPYSMIAGNTSMVIILYLFIIFNKNIQHKKRV